VTYPTSGIAGFLRRRLRATFPHRRVVRDVQGVSLVLPWEHKLPDYVEMFPDYGQNLVELARRLAVQSAPLSVIDIGANVGDSALQIVAATDAMVLCVEADDYWLGYLRENVRGEPRITTAPVFLSTADDVFAVTPVRSGGTSRFEVGAKASSSPPVLSPVQLRESFSDFESVRLIKSDTDGFDTRIVPGAAAAWSKNRPVLFFEFDPQLTRMAGEPNPGALWGELAALGYNEYAVWDNFGQPLGRLGSNHVEEVQGVLDDTLESRGYHYWDVAAVHESDVLGLQALADLMPGQFPLPPSPGTDG